MGTEDGSDQRSDSDVNLIPVEIRGICPVGDPEGSGSMFESFLVLLQDAADCVVPITIGQFEGQVLYLARNQKKLGQRPLAYDLLQTLIREMEGEVSKLVIHSLKEGVFHGYLVVQLAGRTVYLDCRPSDGMILATMMGVEIFMSPDVVEAAGHKLASLDSHADIDAETLAKILAAEDDTENGKEVGELIPVESPGLAPPMSELEKLEAQLTRLVSEEAYEEAAKIRDQISRITGSTE